MLLVSNHIYAENVINWVNQKISTPAATWGEALQPVRFMGAGALAITATLEGILLGLSVVIAIAPTSVKKALESLRFQMAVDLSRRISNTYTFQNLQLNTTKAVGLGGCAIIASTAMCIKPQWGIDLFHKWVKSVELPSKSNKILTSIVKGISSIPLPKLNLAHKASKTYKKVHRYCRKHPAVPLSMVSILISSACMGLWIFKVQSNPSNGTLNDIHSPHPKLSKWDWLKIAESEVDVVETVKIWIVAGVLMYHAPSVLEPFRERIDNALPTPLMRAVQAIRACVRKIVKL